MKTIDDIFLHFLQDIYYAERQIVKALPKLAKASESTTLRDGLMHHLEETNQHVVRLQQVFEAIGKPARTKTCEAIQGLLEEGEEVIEEFEKGAARDAGIAACAQAVEHYEMARYGALIAWAKAGGHQNVVSLLEETLAEEKKADATLNKLAISELNPRAAEPAKRKAA